MRDALLAAALSMTLAACSHAAGDAAAPQPVRQSDEVVAAMRDVHARFAGQQASVAQLGDSITHSMAFWAPLAYTDPARYLSNDGLPKHPLEGRWRDRLAAAADHKGPKYGNCSGWRVDQVLEVLDEVLQREQPEVAIIMIGSNDIAGGAAPQDFRENLVELIGKCKAVHCVPIINTIPPRRHLSDAVAELNSIVRLVAAEQQLPLVDYYAEIVRRRPDGEWDGTLISDDGVHPSGGRSGDFSEPNLRESGYALRNWINFLAYREVYFRVLQPQKNLPRPPATENKNKHKDNAAEKAVGKAGIWAPHTTMRIEFDVRGSHRGSHRTDVS